MRKQKDSIRDDVPRCMGTWKRSKGRVSQATSWKVLFKYYRERARLEPIQTATHRSWQWATEPNIF
jgi:hypothetical protein